MLPDTLYTASLFLNVTGFSARLPSDKERAAVIASNVTPFTAPSGIDTTPLTTGLSSVPEISPLIDAEPCRGK